MRKYYSVEQIHDYGVLGIKIELISLEEVLERLEAMREAEFDRLFPDGMK